MAEKRMITKTIVDSDAFLDMPVSSQNLYFHLNVRADDEGFVNSPNKIMKMVGCNKNDLDVLLTKRFVLGFESGIIVIKHWKLHNCIRKDRLKETVHIKEKSMLAEKENGSYTFMTDTCQTIDSQLTDESQHRLDKIRLDKIRLDKDSIEEENEEENKSIEYEMIKKYWNEKENLPSVKVMSQTRKDKTKSRIEEVGLKDFQLAIDKLNESKFATGDNDKGWKASYDWLITNDTNIVKTLEGKYDNKEEEKEKPKIEIFVNPDHL